MQNQSGCTSSIYKADIWFQYWSEASQCFVSQYFKCLVLVKQPVHYQREIEPCEQHLSHQLTQHTCSFFGLSVQLKAWAHYVTQCLGCLNTGRPCIGSHTVGKINILFFHHLCLFHINCMKENRKESMENLDDFAISLGKFDIKILNVMFAGRVEAGFLASLNCIFHLQCDSYIIKHAILHD